MSLNISPDIEARLIAVAQANGASVEEFLQRMIKQSEQARPQKLSPEELVTEFEAWADSFPQTRSTPLSDEALSRESLNPNRV
jgi:hypothetical protein